MSRKEGTGDLGSMSPVTAKPIAAPITAAAPGPARGPLPSVMAAVAIPPSTVPHVYNGSAAMMARPNP